MKLDGTEGGLIFRVQPVKAGDTYCFRKYYYAAVNLFAHKLVLYYMEADPDDPIYDIIAQAEIPDDIDLSDWLQLSISVKGDNIEVSLEGQTLIDVNDDRLSFGTVGLCSTVLSTYFDSVVWSAYVPGGTATVTTTSTVTYTSTVTSTAAGSTTTVTTTLSGTGGTTITETVTAAGSTTTATTTITEMSTVTEPGKTTTVYSVVTRSLPSTVTKTVTTVSKEVVRKIVTKTVEHTVTETQAGWSRCLIATAAFGSEVAPQVQMLREFRDEFVMKTFAGENFMKAFNTFYYSWSPYVAQEEYRNPTLRNLVKLSIYPLIYSLEFSRIAAQPFLMAPELAVLISGVIASFLIGLIYVSPLLAAAALLWRWRRRSFPPLKLHNIAPAILSSLILFMVAEVISSTILMIIASALTVISCVAMGAVSAPIILERILNWRKA